MGFSDFEKKQVKLPSVVSWSFTAYDAHRNCPRKFFLERIKKVKVPISDALTNGIQKHTLCEKYLKGKLKNVPPELRTAEATLAYLRSRNAVAEQSWAFTSKWAKTTWFAKNAWLRMKIDSQHFVDRHILSVDDFKTGKPKESDVYKEQLELYALGGFIVHPQVQEIRPSLLFIEHEFADGECMRVAPEPFLRSQLGELLENWSRRVRHLLKDETYLPSVSWLCGGCYFNANNDGPCTQGSSVSMWKNYYEKGGRRCGK